MNPSANQNLFFPVYGYKHWETCPKIAYHKECILIFYLLILKIWFWIFPVALILYQIFLSYITVANYWSGTELLDCSSCKIMKWNSNVLEQHTLTLAVQVNSNNQGNLWQHAVTSAMFTPVLRILSYEIRVTLTILSHHGKIKNVTVYKKKLLFCFLLLFLNDNK